MLRMNNPPNQQAVGRRNRRASGYRNSNPSIYSLSLNSSAPGMSLISPIIGTPIMASNTSTMTFNASTMPFNASNMLFNKSAMSFNTPTMSLDTQNPFLSMNIQHPTSPPIQSILQPGYSDALSSPSSFLLSKTSQHPSYPIPHSLYQNGYSNNLLRPSDMALSTSQQSLDPEFPTILQQGYPANEMVNPFSSWSLNFDMTLLANTLPTPPALPITPTLSNSPSFDLQIMQMPPTTTTTRKPKHPHKAPKSSLSSFLNPAGRTDNCVPTSLARVGHYDDADSLYRSYYGHDLPKGGLTDEEIADLYARAGKNYDVFGFIKQPNCSAIEAPKGNKFPKCYRKTFMVVCWREDGSGHAVKGYINTTGSPVTILRCYQHSNFGQSVQKDIADVVKIDVYAERQTKGP